MQAIRACVAATVRRDLKEPVAPVERSHEERITFRWRRFLLLAYLVVTASTAQLCLTTQDEIRYSFYSIYSPGIFLTMKVLDNTPAVLSLGKLCDENRYSYEWINGQKPHLIEDGIRIICNTENFVPIVVPGLSSSSSASSSTLRTPMKQESHSSSSSSSSLSSPTVGEIPVREREDAPDSDISPVPVSELVDDRSGEPEEIQANKTQNQIKWKPR